ncbi:MAG: FkbM family methyltransferase [Thermostichales cyanobacterium BF3_bins_165]
MSVALFLLRWRKLTTVLGQPRLRQALLRHRVLAGVEHQGIFARPLATVVDIGANRGQFALAARAFGCRRVYAFEPLPKPAQVCENLFQGDPAVSLYRVAIGETAKRERIHVAARDDSSSLLEITQSQATIFPGTHEVGTLEIEVKPLDQCLSPEEIAPPALLKLDVQGYEYQALLGCESLLQHFDQIYCECSFLELYRGQKLAADVIHYLQQQGFA